MNNLRAGYAMVSSEPAPAQLPVGQNFPITERLRRREWREKSGQATFLDKVFYAYCPLNQIKIPRVLAG